MAVLIVSFLPPIISYGRNISSNPWVEFSDPYSMEGMAGQIKEAAETIVINNGIIPFYQKKYYDDSFDKMKSTYQKNWNSKFDLLLEECTNAYNNMKTFIGTTENEKTTGNIIISKKQQYAAVNQSFKLFEYNIEEMLSNISYEKVLLGSVRENDTNKDDSCHQLMSSMGLKSIKQVNSIDIWSETSVQNNIVIRDIIKSHLEGFYSVVDEYKSPIEDIISNENQILQIKLIRIAVFPFKANISHEGRDGIIDTDIVFLDDKNYIEELKKRNISVNHEAVEWIEKQLSLSKTHNNQINDIIEKKYLVWNSAKADMEKQKVQLVDDIISLKKTLSTSQGSKYLKYIEKYEMAKEKLYKHIFSRDIFIRKEVIGFKETSNKTKLDVLGELASSSIINLTDNSGSYDENTIIINFGAEQEHTSELLNFQMKKKAFKVLYLTFNKSNSRIIYTASVGFKIGLVPFLSDLIYTNTIGMQFKYVYPGTFYTGSPYDEPGRKVNEPLSKHSIRQGFYLQTTEVTQGQWIKVMGYNSSYFKDCGNNCPVERVSWIRAQDFISKLNNIENTKKYRLPTESEWEYVCRAGSETAFCCGDIETRRHGRDSCLEELGWYLWNSDGKPHPVCQMKPNAWGFYDMHGNVWEWCHDIYFEKGDAIPIVGSYPSLQPQRVFRGGAWNSFPSDCRSARRNMAKDSTVSKTIGFRLAISEK